jgi:hypothetical protein
MTSVRSCSLLCVPLVLNIETSSQKTRRCLDLVVRTKHHVHLYTPLAELENEAGYSDVSMSERRRKYWSQ